MCNIKNCPIVKGVIYIFKICFCIYIFRLAWEFAWLDKIEQLYCCIFTGFLFIFILFAKNLAPFFDSINIFGINAKLREVKNLTNDLTKLLIAVAGISLENTLFPLTQENPTYESMENKYNEIQRLLETYNVDNKNIKRIQEKYWHEKIYRIYTKKIFEKINLINQKREYYNEWHNKFEPYVSPEKIKELIKELDITEDDKNLINRYEYYVKNKKHSSIDEWNKLLMLSFIDSYHANTDESNIKE